MLKITSGLGEDHIQFNFSNYLNQLRELEEVKGDKLQLYSTHPTFLNRMQSLIWFSMSHEYHECFETDKKGLYVTEYIFCLSLKKKFINLEETLSGWA